MQYELHHNWQHFNTYALCVAIALSMLYIDIASANETSSIDATETDRYECLIEPMIISSVGSPVQGAIDKLLVDRSDFVTQGQPIAQLVSTIEQANLVQAQARASMQSEIAAREADVQLAKLNLARLQELFKQQLIPAQQRDEALAQRLVAGAALVQALENRQLLQLELLRAQELVAQRTLVSPINGVVVEHNAFPGEFVYDNPVMKIAQLDPLRVEVVLPARLFGTYKPGDMATVYSEIGSAEPLLAKIDIVDRLLDTRSGTFGIRLTLPNADFSIPGGQKCQLQFQSGIDLVSR